MCTKEYLIYQKHTNLVNQPSLIGRINRKHYMVRKIKMVLVEERTKTTTVFIKPG